MEAVGSEKQASIHRPLIGRVGGRGGSSLSPHLALHQNNSSLHLSVGRFWAEQAGILLFFFPSFLRHELNANAGIPRNLNQDRKKKEEEAKACSSLVDESRGIRSS